MAKLMFDAEAEQAPPEQLRLEQTARLRETVDRAYQSSRFYHSLYEEGGVAPEDLQDLEDIQNLPFVDGAALKEAGAHGLALGGRKHLVTASGASGGKQRIPNLFFTRKDQRALGTLAARGLWMAGVREGDLVLNLHPYDHLGAGWGYHLGAQTLGACVVAASPCNGAEGVWSALELGPSVLCSPVGAACCLGRALRERRGRPRLPRLATVVLKEEPGQAERFREAEQVFGVRPTRCFSPIPAYAGVFSYQCPEDQGWHVWADGFLVECIDPSSTDWVAEGSPGELVVTWLCSEGSALIRYRTGLLVTLDGSPCGCGRTHPRITSVLGAVSDAMRVGKRLVFPHQVLEKLAGFPELGRVEMSVERPRSLARFKLRIELAAAEMVQDHDLYQRLVVSISERLLPLLGVTPRIELLAPGALQKGDD